MAKKEEASVDPLRIIRFESSLKSNFSIYLPEVRLGPMAGSKQIARQICTNFKHTRLARMGAGFATRHIETSSNEKIEHVSYCTPTSNDDLRTCSYNFRSHVRKGAATRLVHAAKKLNADIAAVQEVL